MGKGTKKKGPEPPKDLDVPSSESEMDDEPTASEVIELFIQP